MPSLEVEAEAYARTVVVVITIAIVIDPMAVITVRIADPTVAVVVVARVVVADAYAILVIVIATDAITIAETGAARLDRVGRRRHCARAECAQSEQAGNCCALQQVRSFQHGHTPVLSIRRRKR